MKGSDTQSAWLRLSPSAGSSRIALARRGCGTEVTARLQQPSSRSQVSGALRSDLVSFSQVDTPPHPDCFAIRPLPAPGARSAPTVFR